MGNDSIIAFKTREQLRKYLGIFSPQFNDSRWKMEFLGQMLFGIQASRDTLMSEIAQDVRGAGVLLLRDSGWPQVAFRAPREVAWLELPARGTRRLADGV